MSLAQYGFQKLVLLNSAGYSRAELPLDDSVSIVAPNNTGKTSLINALQFLLILDQRNMDFGAHSLEVSRRFYFPDNCAYILLEVLLPSGSAVIGCVGKGLSHDYEYFAYSGGLDVDDYRLGDGSLASQPKLISHLIERDKLAKIYQQTDLRALLYGNRQKQQSDSPDLTIFPLEYSSQAAIYQRILTRTLRLDRLDTREVKNYLLEIFKNDLNDRGVDFKSEWDKSFADVNRDKEQYDAVFRNKVLIETMEVSQQERKSLRGKIIHWRPLIEQGLNDWETYHIQTVNKLSQVQQQLDNHSSALGERQKDIYKEQAKTQQSLKEQQKQQQKYKDLSIQFQFVSGLAQLESRRKQQQDERDELVRLIKNAQSRQSPSVIQKDIKKIERELVDLNQQLKNLGDNLYLRLQQHLPCDSFEVVKRLFARPVLSFSASSKDQAKFDNEQAFKAFVVQIEKCISNNQLILPGLSIDVSSLEPNLVIKTAKELEEDIKDYQGQLEEMRKLLETAESLSEKVRQRNEMDQQIVQLDKDIADFKLLLELREGAEARQSDIVKLSKLLESLEVEESQLDERKGLLAESLQENVGKQNTIEAQHKRINQARNQRQDHQSQFSYLEQLSYLPYMEAGVLDMSVLADQIERYNGYCQKLKQLDDRLQSKLDALHHDDLNKFQYEESAEKELESLFAFAGQLLLEKEAIERKSRSAVVQVAAILRGLRDSLVTLKMRMNEFNNKINRRQLSDLKIFRIEPREEESLVDAIQTLISTSEQVDSGNSFDLFDHNTVLDDKALNKAKDILIREGEARGSIKVEHLFRLVFKIAKENQKPAEFENIDSAASNGTVLMAKLITGLAMLNQMQNPKKAIKTLCYLDEAASLDQKNQRNLIKTASEFGFTLIFASPEPQITARYCVPIGTKNGVNYINRFNWQILEPIDEQQLV